MAPTALLFPAVAVTGHTVVDIGTTLVTTTVELAGQFVTEAAQEVMVISCVLYTVDVVYEPYPEGTTAETGLLLADE